MNETIKAKCKREIKFSVCPLCKAVYLNMGIKNICRTDLKELIPFEEFNYLELAIK